jgi:hypothetical protein
MRPATRYDMICFSLHHWDEIQVTPLDFGDVRVLNAGFVEGRSVLDQRTDLIAALGSLHEDGDQRDLYTIIQIRVPY